MIGRRGVILTGVGGKVEVGDGDDGDEDAGNYDVENVVHGLPLHDEVEGDVLVILGTMDVLPRRLVPDDPLSPFCRAGSRERGQGSGVGGDSYNWKASVQIC